MDASNKPLSPADEGKNSIFNTWSYTIEAGEDGICKTHITKATDKVVTPPGIPATTRPKINLA